jgi:hypothetical protein
MYLHINQTRAESSCSKQEKSDPSVWQIRLSNFVDSNDSHGRRRHSTRELLLQPSDIWIEDRQEPRQPWRLGWWIIDLIDEKKEK